MDNRPGLPLLLPFPTDPGYVWMILGAELLFITNGYVLPFLEGDGLRIGRSAVRPRPSPPLLSDV